MEKSTVYIDESGDLGKGKGTRWFVITAVIVKEENEEEIKNIIRNVKTTLNISEIHIRKISDLYCKSFIVKELNEGDFTYVNVISDTSKMRLSSDVAYNYMCRMLLERVSWYLRDEKTTADVILSSRSEKRDGKLIGYINKLITYGNNEIKGEFFESVTAKKANELDLLQLADVCATTTFLAYEENKWGMRTPCLFNILREHLYRRNGELKKYGIKYLSDEMADGLEGDKNKIPCLRK